jgi:hypothetical protein
MATYASIKYDMDLSSNATGTGGMTLLSTQTASSSSTISFTSGIDSTYKEYIFKIYNAHASDGDTNFQFNASVDGGSNYNVTHTSTIFTARHNETDTIARVQYETGRDEGQSTGFQKLNYDTGSDNDENVCVSLRLFDPSNTTFVKHFISTSIDSGRSGGGAQSSFVAGYFNTTSAVNAIQFKFGAGNIDSGTIKLYGVS